MTLHYCVRNRHLLFETLEQRQPLNGDPGIEADRTAIMLGKEVQIPHWVPSEEIPAVRAAYAKITPVPEGKHYELKHIAKDVESHALTDVDEFYASPEFQGFDGTGYSIAILDTGFDLDHPVFGPDNNQDGYGDRIVADVDFVNDDGTASAGPSGDSISHGTHVASTAAGLHAGTYEGVARGPNFVLLQIMNDDGNGHAGLIKEALAWVAAHASIYNIVAVNMSVGFGTLYQSSDHPDILNSEPEYEIGLLNDIRVIMTAAAGNEYDCERNPDGTSMLGIQWPAADQRIISVGATFDAFVGNFNGSKSWICPAGSPTRTTHRSGPDRITAFSNRHPTMLDVFAPGSEMKGAVVGGGYEEDWDGTSMATAYMGGMAVIAQHIAIQNSGVGLNADDFRAFINQSGVMINDGDDENDSVHNYGDNYKRIDADALAQAVYDATFQTGFSAVTQDIAASDIHRGVDILFRVFPSMSMKSPESSPITEDDPPHILRAYADLNGDGAVNTFDLNLVITYFTGSESHDYFTGDIDEDGDVDVFDLDSVLRHWTV